MSYATKYKVEWIDYFGQSAELLIEEQDYGGSSSDIKGTRSPITLTYDTPSDFLLEPVNGSFMTIRLIAQTDYQFLDLYTSNNRKYRITLNIDSSLFWQGFILPDQYQEEYKGPPYVCEFIASDQLGYLRTLAWTGTSVYSEIDALGDILGATDLELDLQEGLNIYEDSHDSTSADSPLDQTYFDGEAFTDKTYYDALYHILFKYSAIIKQCAGEWFIFRPREAFTSYTLRKWTYSYGAYSYTSNQSHNPVVSTTAATVAEASLVRLIPGAMFITPAWQRYELTQNLGLRDAYNDNYNFESWTDDDPHDWTASGTSTHARSGNKLKLESHDTIDSDWKIFTQESALTGVDTNSVIKITLEYTVTVKTGNTMKVRFAFGNGSYWYDQNARAWSSGLKYIYREYVGANDTYPQAEKIEFVTPALNYSGTTFKIYAPILGIGTDYSDCFIELDTFSGQLLKRVSSTNAETYDEEKDHSATIDANNNYKPAAMEMLLGDVLDSGQKNARAIWKGVLFTDSGATDATYSWSTAKHSGTLAEIMQNNFSDLFQHPRQVISAQIYTKLIDSCTVLQEVNNSDKMFLIKRASWEQQAGYWEIEAHQLSFAVAGSDERVLITEDEKLIVTEDDKRIIIE